MLERYSVLERVIRIVIVVVVVLLITVGLTIWLAAASGGAWANPRFLSRLAEQGLIYALLAAGMGLVMVNDEADLSASGTASLAAVIMAALVVNSRAPAAVALLAALSAGVLVGLINGVLIGLLRLPFYVVTLAMYSLVAGLSAALAGNRGLLLPGQTWSGSLIALIALNLAIYGLGVGALFILGRSTSLKWLRGLGARPEAKEQPGSVALTLYRIGAYTLSGLGAAGAGLALLNSIRMALPGGLGDLTFAAIAAAIVGGAPVWKGCTRLIGAFLGSVPVILASNVINMTAISANVRVSPALVWALLALSTAALWKLADWALDRILAARKPVSPEAQPVIQ
jgi:ribose transport system permease protein